MRKKPINIVWLKRDLRTQDHQGLAYAEKAGIDYRIVYFFEPSIISYPDTSERHLQFIHHSIAAINKTLASFNRSVDVFYASALTIFEYLSSNFDIQHIYSYRESGTKLTWQRDKNVAAFTKKNAILFKFQRKPYKRLLIRLSLFLIHSTIVSYYRNKIKNLFYRS